MRYRTLGNSGISVSVVGLGTWPMGGWAWGGPNDAESVRTIRAAIDNGINLIDTSPVYGLGHAEMIIAKAIKPSERDKIIIADKCGLVWLRSAGEPYFKEYGEQIYRDLSPASIRLELEASLKRLKSDYIDLYQTHWQESGVQIADTMDCLLKLKDEGKIRAIGASDIPLPLMHDYYEWGGIDSQQLLFNMLDRDAQTDYLPASEQYGVSVIAHSALAKGLLTGQMSPDRLFPKDDLRSRKRRFRPDVIDAVNNLLRHFAPVRNKHGISQTQLSLAWVIAHSGVASALAGARTAKQAKELAHAGDVVLQPREVQTMDDVLAEFGSIDWVATAAEG